MNIYDGFNCSQPWNLPADVHENPTRVALIASLQVDGLGKQHYDSLASRLTGHSVCGKRIITTNCARFAKQIELG